eukprot:CAMPEP_0117668194 /NCGR_PEP_ID=MMETSP0804-20121206/11404_1 /TAXON_ID=1074897 /ORGANISM="Tetraselmis astigmatica, Strain CCMP880" /LENGTH=82 /DNA_ID=CAMNT_0005476039 /DNA_START=260 /DNA_END=508 /DNA_ORIENTATION=+
MSATQDNPGGESDPPPPEKPEEPASKTPAEPEAEVDPEVAAAQRTAIVTGAISIFVAVAYLALAQFLGNRELLPPPPEAMGL